MGGKIDFEKITKTLEGKPCRYFGTQVRNGQTLHVFGVLGYCVFEVPYNEDGDRMIYDVGSDSYILCDEDHFQIVKDGCDYYGNNVMVQQ